MTTTTIPAPGANWPEIGGRIVGGILSWGGRILGGIVAGPPGAVIGGAVGGAIGRPLGRAATAALANAMQGADDDAEDLADEDATTTCPNCDEVDPCAHLRRGGGTGPNRGGAHGEMTKPTNDNLDSHHIPPKSCFPSEMWDSLPSIQMSPEDHRQTQSHGSNGRDSIIYRQEQCDLIDSGRIDEAIRRDIEDVRRIAREAGDPERYEEAIREMEAYRQCREENSGSGDGQPTEPVQPVRPVTPVSPVGPSPPGSGDGQLTS